MSIQLSVHAENDNLICTAYMAQRGLLRPRDWAIANTYWCPVGPHYGRAWVLCSKADAVQIEERSPNLKLKFQSANGTVTCVKFSFLRARKIKASVATSSSLYMVELGDRRLELSGQYGQQVVPYIQDAITANERADAIVTTGTEGNTVCYRFNDGELLPIPGLKCKQQNQAIPHGSTADDFTRVQYMTGSWFVYNPFTGDYEAQPMGSSLGTVYSTGVGIEVYSGEPVNTDKFSMTSGSFIVPVYHCKLGSDANLQYTTTFGEKALGHTILKYEPDGTPEWQEPLGIDTSTGSPDDGFCIPFYGVAIYDPEIGGHEVQESIYNKDSIEDDTAAIRSAYLADSLLQSHHKVFSGFQRIEPGSHVKAVIYRARNGSGGTEYIQHPGLPGDFEGELQAGLSWGIALGALNLPGTIDGWRTPQAPVEILLATGDVVDTIYRSATVRRINDAEESETESSAYVTKVISATEWEAPPIGGYIGRLAWSHNDRPVFVVDGGGGTSGLVVFYGTANEDSDGAVEDVDVDTTHSIDLSPIPDAADMQWNNDHALTYDVDYKLTGTGYLDDDDVWQIRIIQADHEYRDCPASVTILDGGDVDDIHPYGAVVANTYPPVYGVD